MGGCASTVFGDDDDPLEQADNGPSSGAIWISSHRRPNPLTADWVLGPRIAAGQFGIVYRATPTPAAAQALAAAAEAGWWASGAAGGNGAGGGAVPAAFAVKQISKGRLAGSHSIREVQREIEIMNHVRGHPCVAALYGVYEDAQDVNLVMQLCEGGDLFDAIKARRSTTEDEATATFRALVTALAYCHGLGVAHRDIKPENFLLTSAAPAAGSAGSSPSPESSPGPCGCTASPGASSPAPSPVLADFGLGCFFRAGGPPAKDLVGSAFYVAPEVLSRRYAPAPADVWSLGVVLHVLLAGAHPFRGADDAEIMRAVRKQELDLSAPPWPSLTRAARSLVARMLTKDPAARPTLAQVLAHPWLRESTDGSGGDEEGEEGQQPERRRGALASRLASFAARCLVAREGLRRLAGGLPREETAGSRFLHDAWDTDGDGRLSARELREGLARQGERLRGDEAVALHRATDVDGDGLIDPQEWCAATVVLSPLALRGPLAQGTQGQGHAGGDGEGVTGKSGKGKGSGPHAAAFERAFRGLDADGDGVISVNDLAISLAVLLPINSTSARRAAAERELAAALAEVAGTSADSGVLDRRALAMLLLRRPDAEAAAENARKEGGKEEDKAGRGHHRHRRRSEAGQDDVRPASLPGMVEPGGRGGPGPGPGAAPSHAWGEAGVGGAQAEPRPGAHSQPQTNVQRHSQPASQSQSPMVTPRGVRPGVAAGEARAQGTAGGPHGAGAGRTGGGSGGWCEVG